MTESRPFVGSECAGSGDREGEKQDVTDGICEIKAIYDTLFKDIADDQWKGTGDEVWRKTRKAHEKSLKITKRLKMHGDINEMNEMCKKFMQELTDERWNDGDDTFWRQVHEDNQRYKKKLSELGVIPDEPYVPFQEQVSLKPAQSGSGGDEPMQSGSGGGEPAQSGSGGVEPAHSGDGLVPVQSGLLPVQSGLLSQNSGGKGLVLPQGGFAVPSKNGSMYGKKMCDVHMAGFSMESDAVIRFRKSDGKVAVGDLLVGLGRYTRFADAQDIISQGTSSSGRSVLRTLHSTRNARKGQTRFFGAGLRRQYTLIS